MSWLDETIDELAACDFWPYRPGGTAATEPTAFAALALRAHGRRDAAERATHWLAEHQSADGTLGISATERDPHWPTSLAVLAWCAA
ncbi:MAG TPA: hypothetical protein VG713_09935, partial [Pirellulales bacterium]|nr:hypothetical protein [Pirellulales bacterium]